MADAVAACSRVTLVTWEQAQIKPVRRECKVTAQVLICVGGDDSVSLTCRSFLFPAWLTIVNDHMTRYRVRLSWVTLDE